jgi:hypothetical protein
MKELLAFAGLMKQSQLRNALVDEDCEEVDDDSANGCDHQMKGKPAFVLIAIANNINYPHDLELSPMEMPEVMVFSPYSDTALHTILEDRCFGLYTKPSIDFIVRKTAMKTGSSEKWDFLFDFFFFLFNRTNTILTILGDIRTLLHLASKCLQYAEERYVAEQGASGKRITSTYELRTCLRMDCFDLI